MIEHPYVVQDIGAEGNEWLGGGFHVMLEDRGPVAVKSCPHDRLDHVFDPAVHRRHPVGELAQSCSMDPFEAAELQDMFVCQPKPLMEQNNPGVGNLLGTVSLAAPCDAAEAPAMPVHGKGIPGEEAVELGEIGIAQGIDVGNLVTMLSVAGSGRWTLPPRLAEPEGGSESAETSGQEGRPLGCVNQQV
jgi:hypothetical protein